MTLLDIATYACRKINQTDAGDFTAAKSFCQQQFKLIWQSQLWKDSLVEFTQAIDVAVADYAPTSTWLPTKQVLLCPPLLSHVLALRNTTRRFNIQSSEVFYCKDFDDFQNSGTAVDYRLLSPCVWDLDTAQALYRENPNSADSGVTVTVDVVNGTTEQRFTAQELGTEERIESFKKSGVSQGSVNIGTALAGPLTVNQLGSFGLSIGVNDPVNASTPEITQGQSLTLNVSVGNVLYFFFDGIAVGTSYTIVRASGTLNVTAVNDPSGWVFTGISTILVTLGPADTIAPQRQRIQLIGNLETGIVLRVLGKRTPPTFTDDDDEPGLTGVDNVLMALVHGDMLERERRYGQAKLIFDKAAVMMDVLVKEQTVQQAHQKRIIPVDGFGNPYGFDGLLGTKSNPV